MTQKKLYLVGFGSMWRIQRLGTSFVLLLWGVPRPSPICCRGVLDFVHTGTGKQPAGQVGNVDSGDDVVVSERSTL